jgi:uncharacterized membrane protein
MPHRQTMLRCKKTAGGGRPFGGKPMANKGAGDDSDGKWRVGRLATVVLVGGWAAAATVLLAVGDPLGARFLDLPLGALLAGQGALVGLVIVGVRVTAAQGDESA